MLLYEARLPETPDTQTHFVIPTWHSCQFTTDSEINASRTHLILHNHLAPHAKYHTVIGSGRWNSDGSCIAGEVNRQITIFNDFSLRRVICVPIVLRSSLYWISVSKLWEIIICLCMCNSRMGHAKVLDSKSHQLMTHKHDIVLPVTAKLESVK